MARAVARTQQPVVARMRGRGVEILGSVSRVLNAVFVRATPLQAEEIRGLPGVGSVVPAREFQLELDAVADLVGLAPVRSGPLPATGEGIKIAIIDSGPGLRSRSLPGRLAAAPAGLSQGTAGAPQVREPEGDRGSVVHRTAQLRRPRDLDSGRHHPARQLRPRHGSRDDRRRRDRRHSCRPDRRDRAESVPRRVQGQWNARNQLLADHPVDHRRHRRCRGRRHGRAEPQLGRSALLVVGRLCREPAAGPLPSRGRGSAECPSWTSGASSSRPPAIPGRPESGSGPC